MIFESSIALTGNTEKYKKTLLVRKDADAENLNFIFFKGVKDV